MLANYSGLSERAKSEFTIAERICENGFEHDVAAKSVVVVAVYGKTALRKK